MLKQNFNRKFPCSSGVRASIRNNNKLLLQTRQNIYRHSLACAIYNGNPDTDFSISRVFKLTQRERIPRVPNLTFAERGLGRGKESGMILRFFAAVVRKNILCSLTMHKSKVDVTHFSVFLFIASSRRNEHLGIERTTKANEKMEAQTKNGIGAPFERNV